jgi:hypothetical protein
MFERGLRSVVSGVGPSVDANPGDDEEGLIGDGR